MGRLVYVREVRIASKFPFQSSANLPTRTVRPNLDLLAHQLVAAADTKAHPADVEDSEVDSEAAWLQEVVVAAAVKSTSPTFVISFPLARWFAVILISTENSFLTL